MKHAVQFFFLIIGLSMFISCSSNADRKPASDAAIEDSVSIPAEEPIEAEAPAMASPDEVTSGAGAGSGEYLGGSGGLETEVPKVVHARPPRTDGSLVYYCPARMLEDADNNVSVTITKAAVQEAIFQLEKRVAATTGQPAGEIRENISGSSISIASKMKVELKFSEKDFQTIYQPEHSDQIFDGENDMHWDWIIKPVSIGSKQLTIIVSAFDEQNGRWIAVQSPPKIFSINVQIDPRSYVSKLWGFFGSHPEWLLTQLLFPLIAFFYGRITGRKNQNKD